MVNMGDNNDVSYVMAIIHSLVQVTALLLTHFVLRAVLIGAESGCFCYPVQALRNQSLAVCGAPAVG
jgi:hypothetical protein